MTMESTPKLRPVCRAGAQRMLQTKAIREAGEPLSEEGRFNLDLVTLGEADAETVVDRMLWGLVGETISLTQKSADEVAALRDAPPEPTGNLADTGDETPVSPGFSDFSPRGSDANTGSTHAPDTPPLVDAFNPSLIGARAGWPVDRDATPNSEVSGSDLHADLMACTGRK